MDHVTSLKSRVHEMAHREEDAYQQMKKGIEMVEQGPARTDSGIAKNHISPYFTIIFFNVLAQILVISLKLRVKKNLGIHYHKRKNFVSMADEEITGD